MCKTLGVGSLGCGLYLLILDLMGVWGMGYYLLIWGFDECVMYLIRS